MRSPEASARQITVENRDLGKVIDAADVAAQ
jgi:hypothetical protein